MFQRKIGFAALGKPLGEFFVGFPEFRIKPGGFQIVLFHEIGEMQPPRGRGKPKMIIRNGWLKSESACELVKRLLCLPLSIERIAAN